jgi:ABC-type amino acid transport substrate-binding protein
MTTNHRRSLTVLAGLLLLGGVACASAADADGSPATTAPPTQPTRPGDGWTDGFDVDAARDAASALLGMTESFLPDAVRVARRGGELMMLTEDYVLGRITVELDNDGDGFRVTSATVELPDGPETVVLAAG